MALSYHLPFDYVLYDMSYANVYMYNAVLPSYDFDAKKGAENRKGVKTRRGLSFSSFMNEMKVIKATGK
jgi:hypothetical protein